MASVYHMTHEEYVSVRPQVIAAFKDKPPMKVESVLATIKEEVEHPNLDEGYVLYRLVDDRLLDVGLDWSMKLSKHALALE